jgi:MFS family permease
MYRLHKVAPQKVVPWAVLLMGAGLLVAGFLPINIGFYAMIGIYCVGIALFLPNMNAYVSNEAAADQQGSTMAMMTSSQSLMDIMVTLLGSFFVSYYLPAPYVVGGAIILVSLLLWMMWHKQEN